jgi:hypothetical protein
MRKEKFSVLCLIETFLLLNSELIWQIWAEDDNECFRRVFENPKIDSVTKVCLVARCWQRELFLETPKVQEAFELTHLQDSPPRLPQSLRLTKKNIHFVFDFHLYFQSSTQPSTLSHHLSVNTVAENDLVVVTKQSDFTWYKDKWSCGVDWKFKAIGNWSVCC